MPHYLGLSQGNRKGIAGLNLGLNPAVMHPERANNDMKSLLTDTYIFSIHP